MSTKVAQSMTVVESPSTAPPKIAFNARVLKTKNGALKFLELAIEVVCLNLLVTREYTDIHAEAAYSVFFILVCFLMTSVITALLLVSYLMSPMAESVLPKTTFELMTDAAAFIFFIMTGLALLVGINIEDHEYPTFGYCMALAIMGVINGILYAFSSYFSFKTLRSP